MAHRLPLTLPTIDHAHAQPGKLLLSFRRTRKVVLLPRAFEYSEPRRRVIFWFPSGFFCLILNGRVSRSCRARQVKKPGKTGLKVT